MYLGVDLGGRRMIKENFTPSGELLKIVKFPTSENYDKFLKDFGDNYRRLDMKELEKSVVAVPGLLDREHGRALAYGTLLWPPVSIEADIEKIIACPVIIENDSKLAGLSEAIIIIKEFKRVLYVTIG